MKKKRNIRAEIQKLLRPDKVKKINEEQLKQAAKEQAETEKKVILAVAEILEPENEVQTELQKNEYAEPKAEQTTEVQSGEQAEPKAEQTTEVQPEQKAEFQTENSIKLAIKNIKINTAENTRYELYIQIKPEMNTSIVLKNQLYVNFTKMIMGKYGFERLNSTFSKLIFRQYQMLLKEDRPEVNAKSNRIIKNYTSFFNINKSVFNLMAQSIVTTNTKSNKEVRVPFYIFRNFKLNSGIESSNGLECVKEALKLLPKCSSIEEQRINSIKNNVGTISNLYNLHYTQKAQEKLVETQKGEILNNTIDRMTRMISEPISLFLVSQAFEKRIETLTTKMQMKNSVTYILSDKANMPAAKLLYDSNQPSKLRALIPELSRSISFEKRSLSNRTSIGSNIEIINISKIGSANRNTNKDINKSESRVNVWNIFEKDNGSYDRTKNNNIITNIYKNIITNSAINTPVNETNNLAINRTINQTTNGSSNKNIKNNIITKRIDNGVLNTTINSNSNGFINKTVNIITNKGTNRFENIEETNRYPQFSLMKNSLENNEVQEQIPTELESVEKDKEGQQKSASEDIRQSEIILRTTLTKKDYTPKTKELLKSALVQKDGAISKIIKNFSNKQNAEGDEDTAYKKSNFQNRTSLIPAKIKQSTKLKGASTFTGEQLDDNSLIFCKPHIKETSIVTEEAQKNANKSAEQVFAKSVTSSKPQSKYNQIEVEEVNQIAERVYKLIEKRISIQKDRRGLR